VSVRDPEVLDVGDDVPEQSRRPVVAGAAAGLWALLVGVALVTCVVMLAWAVSPNSAGDSAAAWRAAGAVWLGAHQVPLEIGGRSLTLLPLGALLLGLALTRRGGRWAGRLLAGTSPGEAAGIVTSGTLVYAAGGAGVAWLSAGPGTSASPLTAFVWTGAVALVGATWGVAREAGLVAWARSRVSDAAWRTAMGGLAAVVGLFATGAVLVTVSLVRHAGQIAGTLADLEAGPVGELALTVLGALCLPTLDVWAMSVLVGPGFDLGSAGALNAFGGQVETLPALPVLAAIPTTVPVWGPALMLVPVALGVLAGRIRWGRDLPTPTGTAASGAGLAGVVAALVGGLVLLASGSLGGGRLDAVGPLLLPVVAASAGLVLAGFLAEAGLQSVRLSWELHQAERRAEERRLRRAARGVAEPAEADAAAGDPPVDVDVEVDGRAGDGEQDRAPARQPAARRQPRPVRESLVIPIVVATGAPDVADGQPVGETMPDRSEADVRSDGRGEAPQQGARRETGDDDSGVAVDLTADPGSDADPQPDLGALEPDAVGEFPPDPDHPAIDGDSTVDLTVDPTDLAEIRAAWRQGSPGEGTS
jgi:hypothetical protein